MTKEKAVELAENKLTSEEIKELQKISVNKGLYEKILLRITSLIVYSEV